ncbi:MAG: DUF6430 domain-containing protein [Lachnospira sp.]|nr:DUF6430 domain-containing protein [Lachnospira sp.]
MYFCVGSFLTALKICKAASTKQKQLGEKVFQTLYPQYNCGDDDSSISAIFRGKRNLNSYLQLMMYDLDPKTITFSFQENVIPLLDENKFSFLVRLLQMMIRQDAIDEETHVELVNGIKKKDLIHMDEVVLEDFLVGIFLYLIKNTDNLNKEREVKAFKAFAKEFEKTEYERVAFIDQYSSSSIFADKKIRPIITLYKNASCIIDVVAVDLFDIPAKKGPLEKVNIVIPVNTSFETRIEGKHGEVVIPLVSENTIHGQWIKYMNNKGLRSQKLDDLIELGLKKNGVVKCGVCNSVVGKNDIYPIASTAIVPIDNTNFYLTAVSKFNKKNKAESEISYIRDALNSLIDMYDIEGQGFDLYIPLIGSGRSRTGMTLQESYELMVESIINRKNEIYGRIHITIRPSQITEVELENNKNVQ